MLDNLLLEYRSEFYDLNFKKIQELYKKHKNLFLFIIIFIFIGIATIIYSVINRSNIQIFIFILIELILSIVCDRLMVKRYQQYISTQKEHIHNVTLFLKKAVPDYDLFSKKQVEELIDRLSMRIDTDAPFNKLKSGLINFGKAIVLPMIAYIAGIYSSKVSELDIMTVLSWAI